MFTLGSVGFGDKVRIAEAEETVASGHAGLVGDCFGMTTPSATDVDLIGDAIDDVALNVNFGSEGIPDAWFAPELVLLVEHPEGARAVVGTQAFVMDSTGDWHAESAVNPEPSRRRRRLWRR